MKHLSHLLWGIVLLAAISCTAPQDSLGYLQIFSQTSSFSSNGGNATLSISSSVNWTLSTSSTKDNSWISFSAYEGIGNGTVEFAVLPNETQESRSTTIMVSAAGIVESVEIIQTAQNQLSVNNVTLLQANSPDQAFTVDAAEDWTAEAITTKEASSWFSIYPESGNAGASQISVSMLEANNTMSARTGYVKIMFGRRAVYVTVVQKQKDAILASSDKVELNGNANSFTVTLQSNVAYQISYPEWIQEDQTANTKALVTKQVKFNATANNSGSSRSGQIIFSGNGVSETVTVYQSEPTVLVLGNGTLAMSSAIETQNVDLQTNTEYSISVEGNPSWLTASLHPTRVDQIVINTTQANTSYQARTAKVVVKDLNSDLQDELVVEQAPAQYLKVVEGSSQNVAATSDNYQVTIRTNGAYQVTLPEWITESGSASQESYSENFTDYTHTFTVSENTSYTARQGQVTFTATQGTLSASSVFNQNQSEYLSISGNLSPNFGVNGGTSTVQVATNVAFSVIIPAEAKGWLSATATGSPVVGQDGLTITSYRIGVVDNEGYEGRASTVTFSYGNGKTAVVNVSQGQTDYLGINGNTSVQVGAEGDEISVSISSNLSFETIIPNNVSWISEGAQTSNTAGLEETIVTLSVKPNTTYGSRAASITFYNSDTYQATLTVSQDQNNALILTSNSNVSVSANGGSFTVKLDSNVDYEFAYAPTSTSWISHISTKSLTSSTFTFKAASNSTSASSRTANIVFKAVDSDLTTTITVNQEGNPYLATGASAYNVAAAGGSVNIAVDANVIYSVSIPSSCSWLSDTNNGVYGSTLSFKAAKNTTASQRSATITLAQSNANGSPISTSFTITQEGGGNSAPSRPSITNPGSGETNVSTTPAFTWSTSVDEDGDDVNYTLYLSTNNSSWTSYGPFANDPTNNCQVATLSSSLVGSTTYYVKVGASDGENAEVKSATYMFTTASAGYADGEVRVYMRSSKATPCVLIFMGDGYIAEDYATGGAFDQDIDEGIENFFSIEPYKSYREYFTVYKVAAYSNARGMTVGSNKVDTKFKVTQMVATATSLYCVNATVFEYAAKVPGVSTAAYTDALLANSAIVLVANSDTYAGTCWTWSNGASIAICPVSRQENTLYQRYDYKGLINHEAGGHGWGRLADEYVSYNYSITETTKTKNAAYLQKWQGYGFNKNVDLTNDLSQILWKALVGREGYEAVGAYEGGFLYSGGVWRSEERACMQYNESYYSVMQRYLMVERILTVSGEVSASDTNTMVERFLARDKVKSYAEAIGHSSAKATKDASNAKFIPLAEPVMVE